MQATIKEILEKMYSELFVSREIVIRTNVFAILAATGAIGWILCSAAKYLRLNHQRQHVHRKNKDSRKWYPTGWY